MSNFKTKIYLCVIKLCQTGNFEEMQSFLQHGNTTTFEHVIFVAFIACFIVKIFHIKKISIDSMIKGALLHDYYLYDWHTIKKGNKLHGFTHPIIASKNAKKDYNITEKEENMIKSHMFPMSTTIPKSKEAIIISIADKYCAITESLNLPMVQKLKNEIALYQDSIKN